MRIDYLEFKELYHHGIKGMSWGRRNGPPYPLGFSKHSAKEKRLNPKSVIDGKPDEDRKRKGLSKGAKTAIVIGGVAVAAGLAAYGVYRYNKIGGFDSSIIAKGKEAFQESAAGDIEIPRKVFDTAKADSVDPNGFFKRLQKPESLSEVCQNGNPNRGDPEYKNNCVRTSLTAFLRTHGIDVTPLNNHGKDAKLGEVLREVFPGISDNERRFREVPCSQWSGSDSAKRAITRMVGKDISHAEGVISIPRASATGKKYSSHAFNWILDNGTVSFFDCQMKGANVLLETNVFNLIDKSGRADAHAIIARLDGLQVGESARKYVG